MTATVSEPREEKTTAMRLMEFEHGGRDITELVTDALNDAGTVEAAAERLSVSHPTLRAWMRQLGITFKRVAQVDPQKSAVS